MRKYLLLLPFALAACSAPESHESAVLNKDSLKEEIRKTEKAFEAYVADHGVAEGFHEFADSMAVIKRRDDSLIMGKGDILTYYTAKKLDSVSVTWDADYIDVSDDGTLAWSYGHYEWKVPADSGKTETYTGVFHTVWKKQADGSWKYVWD